ncbi:MAG: glycerophosphodiester phosphodiesterase family protein [Acidobacteriota bacterium]
MERDFADRPPNLQAFWAADRPRVIAHRGFSGVAPENTLAAVSRALDLGVDMVEIDVTSSVDGHVIVLHDETLDRTTSGSGPALETPLEALRSLDAGSWFAPEFAGERIPLLAEVLDLVAGKTLLNVEIKGEAVAPGANPAAPGEGGGIARRIAELVRERGLEDQTLISSFHPAALAHSRAAAPEIARAVLFSPEFYGGKTPTGAALESAAACFNVSARNLDQAMLENAASGGLPVAVYTVNDADRMRELRDLGVAAIFTDRPDRMLEVLASRAV